MRIMIVDDEESIRELLAYNLTKAGYEVVQAGDGRTALQLAANLDMILLDVMEGIPILIVPF